MKKLIIAAALLLAAASAGVGCGKPSDRGSVQVPVSTGYIVRPTERAVQREAPKQDGKKHTPPPDSSSQKDTAIRKEDIGSMTVLSEQVFKDGGLAFFCVPCDAVYTVTVDKGDTEADWKVFVLDDKFMGDVSALLSDNAPALEGEGSVSVTAGQYLYLYCTVNCTNAADIVEGSAVTVRGPGVSSN